MSKVSARESSLRNSVKSSKEVFTSTCEWEGLKESLVWPTDRPTGKGWKKAQCDRQTDQQGRAERKLSATDRQQVIQLRARHQKRQISTNLVVSVLHDIFDDLLFIVEPSLEIFHVEFVQIQRRWSLCINDNEFHFIGSTVNMPLMSLTCVGLSLEEASNVY